MFKIAVCLAILRWAAGYITDDYTESAKPCRDLVYKAQNADVPSVKAAYALEAVQLDQKITRETLAKFHLATFSQNTTYASLDQVLDFACRPLPVIQTTLDWTSGFVSSTIVWAIVLLCRNVRVPKRVARVKTPQPSPRKPPRSPPPRDPTPALTAPPAPTPAPTPDMVPAPEPSNVEPLRLGPTRRAGSSGKPPLHNMRKRKSRVRLNDIPADVRKRIMEV